MARIAQIVSTARYLPPHLVSNAELTERFTALGRPHVIDKLAASTGISKRFYVPDDWVTSDLALMAAKEALKRAGRRPEDIDLIILGTTSPDYITPASSVVLQHKLGAKNAGAFDVDCACAAFPALVATGAGLIITNPAMKTVLLVGCLRTNNNTLITKSHPLQCSNGGEIRASYSLLSETDSPRKTWLLS